MALWPEATFRPGAPHGGPFAKGYPLAVTLHHQAGYGDPLNVYITRRVSAHFWVPRSGKPLQHVDTANQAWHGTSAHNPRSLGVETEGCASPPYADPLTENQLDWFAKLMAWANQAHGIPLQLSGAVTAPGLNYHRCQGGPATGCPCDTRVNQRPEILRRAKAILAAPPTSTAPAFYDDSVFVETDQADTDGKPVLLWFIANGAASYYRKVPAGLKASVPERMKVKDPAGSWRQLWKVGA